MKQYITGIAVISIVLVLIGWVVFSQLIPEYYLPVLPLLMLFFIATSVLIHAYQLQLAKKDIAKFTRSNMLITFFRLIIYSAVAIIYIAFDTKNAKIFVIYFVLLYLVFTIFEVFSLVNTAKGNKKKAQSKKV
ncbi:MAG TPA: hypothetical protein VLQ91_04600 [Draconibacterium sp.]|nr:hypothetical protein [Draconibacterium sp.]